MYKLYYNVPQGQQGTIDWDTRPKQGGITVAPHVLSSRQSPTPSQDLCLPHFSILNFVSLDFILFDLLYHIITIPDKFISHMIKKAYGHLIL